MMPKRAFIIHGYLSYPEEAWLPWMKAQLELKGYEAALPAMPSPNRPDIAEWIGFITRLVGEPDDQTVMIGHSLGCQAVIRYLETLGAAGKAVGKTVLVAGRFPSVMTLDEAHKKVGDGKALIPWFTIGVDSAKVKKATGSLTVILSDNDPIIPLEHAKSSYPASLGARIIIDRGKGHFNEDDGLTELPSALEAVIA